MSLTIYRMPASRTVRRPWALEALGLAYENVPYCYLGPGAQAAIALREAKEAD